MLSDKRNGNTKMIRSAHQATMSEYVASFVMASADYRASPVSLLKNDYRVALDKGEAAEEAVFAARKILGLANKAPKIGMRSLIGKNPDRAEKMRDAMVMLNKARARYNRAMRELGSAFDALNNYPGAAIAVRASR